MSAPKSDHDFEWLRAKLAQMTDSEVQSWKYRFGRLRDDWHGQGRSTTQTDFLNAMAIVLDDELIRRKVELARLDPAHDDDVGDRGWRATIEEE